MLKNYEELPSKIINFQEFENKRKEVYEKRKKRLTIVSIFAGLATIAGIILLIFLDGPESMPGFLLILFSVGFLVYEITKPKGHIELKNKITNALLKAIDPSFTYSVGNYESGKGDYRFASKIYLAGFIPDKFVGFDADDVCRGKINGYEFALGDVRGEKSEVGYDQKIKSTVYKGPFAFAKTSNNFPFTSIVSRQSFIKRKLLEKLGIHRAEQNKITIINDPDFEKLFEIWTSDEKITRQILTPQFREYLKSLPEYTNVGWRDDYIFFGMSNSHDLFSLNIKEEITEDIIRDFYNDFAFYYNIFENIISFVTTGSAANEKENKDMNNKKLE